MNSPESDIYHSSLASRKGSQTWTCWAAKLPKSSWPETMTFEKRMTRRIRPQKYNWQTNTTEATKSLAISIHDKLIGMLQMILHGTHLSTTKQLAIPQLSINKYEQLSDRNFSMQA